MLYLIRGDYPDRTCQIGEVGILSRERKISNKDTEKLQKLIRNYNIRLELDVMHQSEFHYIKNEIYENNNFGM